MATLFYNLGDFKHSESCYVLYAKLIEINYGFDSLEASNCYFLISVFYLENKFLRKAMACVRQAQAIREKRLGYKTVMVADCLYNSGVILVSSGFLEEGKGVLEEGLKIVVEVLSCGHLKAAKSYELIGVIDCRLGNYKEGRRKLEYAFEVKRKLGYKEDHREILGIKAILGFVENGPVGVAENAGGTEQSEVVGGENDGVGEADRVGKFERLQRVLSDVDVPGGEEKRGVSFGTPEKIPNNAGGSFLSNSERPRGSDGSQVTIDTEIVCKKTKDRTISSKKGILKNSGGQKSGPNSVSDTSDPSRDRTGKKFDSQSTTFATNNLDKNFGDQGLDTKVAIDGIVRAGEIFSKEDSKENFVASFDQNSRLCLTNENGSVWVFESIEDLFGEGTCGVSCGQIQGGQANLVHGGIAVKASLMGFTMNFKFLKTERFVGAKKTNPSGEEFVFNGGIGLEGDGGPEFGGGAKFSDKKFDKILADFEDFEFEATPSPSRSPDKRGTFDKAESRESFLRNWGGHVSEIKDNLPESQVIAGTTSNASSSPGKSGIGSSLSRDQSRSRPGTSQVRDEQKRERFEKRLDAERQKHKKKDEILRNSPSRGDKTSTSILSDNSLVINSPKGQRPNIISAYDQMSINDPQTPDGTPEKTPDRTPDSSVQKNLSNLSTAIKNETLTRKEQFRQKWLEEKNLSPLDSSTVSKKSKSQDTSVRSNANRFVDKFLKKVEYTKAKREKFSQSDLSKSD